MNGDGKSEWLDTFAQIVQMYVTFHRAHAQKLLDNIQQLYNTGAIDFNTYNQQTAGVNAIMYANLWRAHLKPLVVTMHVIHNEFRQQDIDRANQAFLECMHEVGNEQKLQYWTKAHNFGEFIARMTRVLKPVWTPMTELNHNLRALGLLERCWATRYLGNPHSLALGRVDSLKLRKLVLEFAQSDTSPAPPVTAAAAAAAAPAVGPADVKSNYPAFRAAVSVFGRPVVPLDWKPAKLTGGTGQTCRARRVGQDPLRRNWKLVRQTYFPAG
jgi:hypothetical protein